MKKWLLILMAASLIGVMIGVAVSRDSQTLPALYDMRTGEVVLFLDKGTKKSFMLKEADGRILFMGEEKADGQIVTGNLVVGKQSVWEKGREYYDIAMINLKDGTVYPISRHTSSIMIGDTFVFLAHDTMSASEPEQAQGEAPRVEMVLFRTR